MTFRVGQKVVCVDDSGMALSHVSSSDPVKGCVYTIRGIVSADGCFDNLPGVLLEEIISQIHPFWNEEYGFRQSRFRPIVERKTDISIFTTMLNPSKRSVDA